MNPGVVASLRDLVPLRGLTYAEHLRIAELQANRFLKLVGVTESPVPERVIEELPRVSVQRITPFPASGATQWVNRQWVVVLRASEPRVRQRFSLAHELKHIIDHRFADIVFAGFDPSKRHDLAEHVCDYFAGCLLVPRPWLKSSWGSGLQDAAGLARRFDVSTAAIETRLAQIGLGTPPPRCLPPSADRSRPMSLRTFTYHRGMGEWPLISLAT